MSKRLKRTDVTLVPLGETCENCGGTVDIMIFKGTGMCSDTCAKALGRGPKEVLRGTAGL